MSELIRAHYPEFLGPVFPRLCLIALTFAQPFLVRRAIDYVSEPESPDTSQRGGGLVAAYIFVYFGLAVRASVETGAALAYILAYRSLVRFTNKRLSVLPHSSAANYLSVSMSTPCDWVVQWTLQTRAQQ